MKYITGTLQILMQLLYMYNYVQETHVSCSDIYIALIICYSLHWLVTIQELIIQMASQLIHMK